MNPQNDRRSFTLPELILIAVVVGILALVAVPRFQSLQASSREKGMRAALASIRAAIIAYRENEITSGRAQGSGNTRALRGWPQSGQIQDGKCGAQCPLTSCIPPGGANCIPKIMENGELPDNPYSAIGAGLRDYVKPESTPTDCAYDPGPSKGAPPDPGNYGWRYNDCSGEFWANTNAVPGENSW